MAKIIFKLVIYPSISHYVSMSIHYYDLYKVYSVLFYHIIDYIHPIASIMNIP